MATDWLVYYMTRPLGLAAIALAVALPFLVWRLVLGRASTQFGYKPLAAGYLFAAAALLSMNLSFSYFEFSSRVASGALSEAERWKHVPGWSLYVSVISLLFILPMLGLIATPVSALLLRRGALSIKAISAVVVSAWLLVSVCIWLSPSNEWHRTHRLESLLNSLSAIGVGFLFVAVPFSLGIYAASRERARNET
jgi:hypothetical protein